jgi:hypothetical protein
MQFIHLIHISPVFNSHFSVHVCGGHGCEYECVCVCVCVCARACTGSRATPISFLPYTFLTPESFCSILHHYSIAFQDIVLHAPYYFPPYA